MSTYKFTGTTTSDYEIEASPRNGGFDPEDIEFDFMQSIGVDEPEEYTLNRVAIKGDKLIAYATIKHTFSEDMDGKDRDNAEDRFFDWSDTVANANKDHNGKRLYDVDEIELIS